METDLCTFLITECVGNDRDHYQCDDSLNEIFCFQFSVYKYLLLYLALVNLKIADIYLHILEYRLIVFFTLPTTTMTSHGRNIILQPLPLGGCILSVAQYIMSCSPRIQPIAARHVSWGLW